MEMSTIAHGSYATAESRTAELATTDAEYRRLWRERIEESEGRPTDVDFSDGVVVFLFAGSRSTGGWSVEPQSVKVEEDGTAIITARVQGPKTGGMVTQALTSPFAVVLIRDRQVRKVRWAE